MAGWLPLHPGSSSRVLKHTLCPYSFSFTRILEIRCRFCCLTRHDYYNGMKKKKKTEENVKEEDPEVECKCNKNCCFCKMFIHSQLVNFSRAIFLHSQSFTRLLTCLLCKRVHNSLYLRDSNELQLIVCHLNVLPLLFNRGGCCCEAKKVNHLIFSFTHFATQESQRASSAGWSQTKAAATAS